MTGGAAVGLALIGAGPWGRNYIKAIEACPGGRLVALGSRNPEARALVISNCQVFADWRDAIAGPGVDGVVIATPPAIHTEIALAAIAAGRGVLIEKPLALSFAEAQSIAEAAAKLDRPVMVDHIHLHHPAFIALRQMLPKLGPLRSIEAEAGRLGPFRPDTSVLWDWGPHDVAMSLAVVGADPVSLRAQAQQKQTPAGLGETVDLELIFAEGVHARVRLSNVMEQRVRRFKVTCARGWAVYDSVGDQPLLVKLGSQAPQAIATDDRRPLDGIVAAFCAALALRRATPGDVGLGVRVVGVLTHCERALSGPSITP